MKITRKTNILIETQRQFVVRRESADEPMRCEPCDQPMFSVQTAADFFAVSSRTIYRLIESESIHFVETERNEIYVCPISIKQILELIRMVKQ